MVSLERRVNRKQRGNLEIHRIQTHAIVPEQIHQVQQVLLEQVEQGRMEQQEQLIAHARIHPRMTALEFQAIPAAVPRAHRLRAELQGRPTEIEAVVPVIQQQEPPALGKQKEKRIIHLHQARETRTINKVEQMVRGFRKCRCLVGTCIFFIRD
jgi:hypothetical protein